MKFDRGIATAAVAASLVVSTGCLEESGGKTVEPQIPVEVAEVGLGSVEDLVVATGTLRAPQIATLNAETAGLLLVGRRPDGLRYAEGDRVEPGVVLAEITGDEVRVAVRAEASRERLETAQQDYESKKRLFDEDLIALMELEQAESALADAKADMERSVLTETRTRMISPIRGVILEMARDDRGRPLADGQRVIQGQVVLTVAPVDDLVADVDLIGVDAAKIKVGLNARIRHYAWGDEVFRGRLSRIAPSFDPVTRSFRAEIEVPNARGMLRPGMFVEASLVAERHEDVPIVPREAVTERGGRKVVFVLDGNVQRVEQRAVAIGFGDDDVVEVVDGLEPGERIVVRGLETLQDETSVTVGGS